MSDGLAPLSPKSKLNLLNDIKLLMHCYGDVSSPLQSSVVLIQSILQQQTHILLCHLADICNLRETTAITQEDFIFLFRNNKVKLQRLLNHIKAKDLRASVSKEMDANESHNYVETPKGKRFKACEQYINQIDVLGKLSSVLQNTEEDINRQRRLMRQDLMTRTMSEDRYMKYHESRQINLHKRLKLTRVRDWLFGDVEKQYKIGSQSLEIIAFCMHEIIAEVVDLALMLKIESKKSRDPVERLNLVQQPVNCDWLTQRVMLTTDLSALSMLTSLNSTHESMSADSSAESLVNLNAITADEIREALRRRTERISLLQPQMKNHHLCNSTQDLIIL